MYYEQRKLKTVFFLIRNKVVSGSVQQVKNYPSNIPSVKSSSPSFFNIAICTKKVYTCEVRRKEMFSTYFYKKKKRKKLFLFVFLFILFYSAFLCFLYYFYFCLGLINKKRTTKQQRMKISMHRDTQIHKNTPTEHVMRPQQTILYC